MKSFPTHVPRGRRSSGVTAGPVLSAALSLDLTRPWGLDGQAAGLQVLSLVFDLQSAGPQAGRGVGGHGKGEPTRTDG